MSMSKVNVTGLAVVTLTVANQSGSCWLSENDENNVGATDVRIYHTDAGEPSIATIRDLGKKLFKSNGNTDVMVFTPDNTNDVYYAVCKNDEDVADVIKDVV